MTAPRIPLVLLPTPLHRLDRASARLGIDLWIKRDDLTGFAGGGNKGRKLEYLIAEALAFGADTVVTCGSRQSNFIRQLGAACAIVGIRCVAAVMDLPFELEKPKGIKLNLLVGNASLSQIFGVETVHLPDGTWDILFLRSDELAAELQNKGRRVYQIPIGGSSALGAYAFYMASEEIKRSGHEFDWIVTSSSSGSTQTGLTYGFRDQKTIILGVAADPEPTFIDDLVDVGDRLAHLLQVPRLGPADFELETRFVGYGYGVTDKKTLAAISWLAKTEGILLDPIYSGKAFNALIELARGKKVTGKVLFWHTGGTPNLFGLPHQEFANQE